MWHNRTSRDGGCLVGLGLEVRVLGDGIAEVAMHHSQTIQSTSMRGHRLR
jgi:hypothetical protein